MSMNDMPTRMKRSKRRSFRRSNWPIRLAAAAVLLALLIGLGVYYAGKYREHMDYVQYPLRYEELIVSTAEEFGLEPWHVAAVVRCESSFRETATSEAGARGLMQIMPDTGEWLAGKFDEEAAYTADSLYVPETNLKYGCWYLQWLMNRYGGERTVVTAAYHAGHGTVDRWLQDPEISADGKTLRSIPYSSTSTYVERVIRACEKYQELYDFSEAGDAA